MIVREHPAVADRVVAVRHLGFNDEDIAVPMRGTFPLAPEDGMGHLAAIGDVVAHDGILTVLIVLRGGDFQLRLLVLDVVHAALDGVGAENALGRVHLPGAGEKLAAMQRAVYRRGMIYLLGRTITRRSGGIGWTTGKIRSLRWLNREFEAPDFCMRLGNRILAGCGARRVATVAPHYSITRYFDRISTRVASNWGLSLKPKADDLPAYNHILDGTWRISDREFRFRVVDNPALERTRADDDRRSVFVNCVDSATQPDCFRWSFLLVLCAYHTGRARNEKHAGEPCDQASHAHRVPLISERKRSPS